MEVNAKRSLDGNTYHMIHVHGLNRLTHLNLHNTETGQSSTNIHDFLNSAVLVKDSLEFVYNTKQLIYLYLFVSLLL